MFLVSSKFGRNEVLSVMELYLPCLPSCFSALIFYFIFMTLQCLKPGECLINTCWLNTWVHLVDDRSSAENTLIIKVQKNGQFSGMIKHVRT